MSVSRSVTKTHWIKLPATVDQGALDSVVAILAQAGPRVRTILDFEHSAHIDYRALRNFADRLRQLGQVMRPVVLVGLNAYCTHIVRFTLRPDDWELFGVPDGVVEPEQGVDALAQRRAELFSGAGWLPWSVDSASWSPHMN